MALNVEYIIINLDSEIRNCEANISNLEDDKRIISEEIERERGRIQGYKEAISMLEKIGEE